MALGQRHVAYVIRTPFVSGAERSLIRMLEALDPARYRPFVVATHSDDLQRALDGGRIEHAFMSMPWPERAWPFPFVLATGRLALRLRRAGAALVHVNDSPAYPLAGIAARLIGLPRICHLRFPYDAEGLRWQLKRGVDRILFASKYLERYAQAQCPDLFSPDRCVVIHDGFDPPPVPAPEQLARLRGALYLAPGDPVIGFFGQVIEVKGVREYLLMAERLLHQLPDSRFLIVGDDRQAGPSYRVRMEALARELGIANACRFTGFRDDVWELLHLCDVVVIPSHVENFAAVALEAAGAGRPLVASRVGGLPEIIQDGETGMLVPPGDAVALSKAAWDLLSNPARRAEMGARARASVMRFGAASQTRELENLYDEVLAEHRTH